MNAPAEKIDESVLVRFEEWMLPEIFEMMKDAYEESDVMKRFPFSERRVLEMLEYATIDPRLFSNASIKMGKERPIIEGVVVASVGSMFYTEEPIVNDVVVYVRPEFRNSFVLRRLLVAYERWAQRIGVKKLIFTQGTGNSPDRTEKLMEGFGWKWIGSMMIRDMGGKDGD